jgi:hypothetical protein
MALISDLSDHIKLIFINIANTIPITPNNLFGIALNIA